MKRVHYNVAPRYSAGSPAQVDFATASGVVDDERRAYAATLEGIYGPEAVAEAQTAGLKGIVEEREERADCWLVTDLITGDRFVRLFPSNDRTISEKRRLSRLDKVRWKYRLPVEGYNEQT